ncbi:putative hydroxyacylglutathione hydrolase [Penicillium chrysogenum]|uniref:hydroxyacylglutathione hydrolase n=1 Tax=Penicillium chrysogenum TaxID=5076 RepID=A0A167TSV8_PENCH|nr:hypothetical protein NUH16_007821 [Penicillium rubens]KZN88583.1 putative hydroxyacylglutathione hydrolase [Penicillium chrysogenum]
MAKVIFTAWKTKSQLLEVRNEFYPPPTYAGPDLRSHGCAVVEAWKLRGNVPHHVEATALLTDAILHDDAQRNSIFSIRATYSAAFCRFVTGLVDTKIHGVRRTMFQRATDLGLPASFVELRHEATHREPPSLVVLRKAAQRSLEWLWDNYWAGVGDDSGAPALTHDDGASVRAALCDALQPLSGGSADSVPKKRKRDQAVSVAMRLVSVCNVSGTAARLLSSVLLERGFLVPSGRVLGDSMNDAFKEWNPVLQRVAESHPAFLRHLTEDLVNDLAFKNTTDISADAPSEALYLWIAHILTSPAWEFHRQSCPQSYVLRACDESPHHWTKLLGDQLRKHASKPKPALGARPAAKNRITKPKHVRNDSQYAPSQLSEKLLEHGWGFLEKWDSRPLGVVSRTGKGNNYAYLVTDEPTKQSVIIDPANPPEVAPELKSQIASGKIDLTAIVNTHHHWDHAGGNGDILKQFKGLQVIGGKDCASVTKTPAHGEEFKIGDRISVKALHTPCHTQDSICYYMQDGDQRAVFTGDTLFIGGCGRFFEGNAKEMHKALNETLAALPDDTKPGHEYTKANVKFCIAVSQTEPIKKLQAFADQNKQTQGKFTIGDEKLHNVFMRVNDPEIQKVTGKTDPVDVMAALREMKNSM